MENPLEHVRHEEEATLDLLTYQGESAKSVVELLTHYGIKALKPVGYGEAEQIAESVPDWIDGKPIYEVSISIRRITKDNPLPSYRRRVKRRSNPGSGFPKRLVMTMED